MTLVHTRHVAIEWGDCDPAGIVWNPRYFGLFDAATVGLFAAALDMKKSEMMKRYDMAGIPLVETRAKFLAPCRYGDEVRIESSVAEFRRSSFDVSHRLYRGDTLCVEGFETRVWVGRDPADPAKLKSKPIPPEVIARFG
jgi:4-hydroxybenzoyl-CoA thioesterase